jgi:MFS family permease
MLNMICFSLGIGLVSAPKMELFTQVICQHIDFGHNPGAEECRQSTAVQKQLAQLNTILSLVTGTLCIATTAFWGGISDRYGRRGALILNMLSFVLGDVIFIVVLSNASRFPYYLVILSPFFEGLFGGHPGNQSISAAYLGDCTPAGSRAGIFSILTVILFGGIAAGPAISSLLITYTGTIFAPFYASLALHVAQGLFFLVFLPESISPQRKLQAQHAHEQKKKSQTARKRQRMWGVDFVRGLVSPIGLLAPRRVAVPNSHKTRLDWSLPLVATVSAIYAMGIALYPVKLQYAQLEFGWSAVELGNLLSFIGVGRIIALLVAIPLISNILRKITAASAPKYPAMSQAALDRKGSTAARDRLEHETRLVQDHSKAIS